MLEIKNFFKDKKNLRNFIILLVVIITLPIGIYLAKNRQIFFSQADRGSPIEVLAGNCIVEKNGKKSLICSEVPLKLISPLGPPLNSSSPLPSSTSQPSPMASTTPSNSPVTSPTSGASTSPAPSPQPSPAQPISFVSQPLFVNTKKHNSITFTTNQCPQIFTVSILFKGKPQTPFTPAQFNCTTGQITQTLPDGFVIDDKKGSCNELTVTATGSDGSQATSNILKWCSNNDG